jgi:hypothetical protein
VSVLLFWITQACLLTYGLVYEYIPDCCFKNGDEFYHPWLYNGIELDALEVVSHEKARRLRKEMSDEMKKRDARRIAWRGPEACDPPTQA